MISVEPRSLSARQKFGTDNGEGNKQQLRQSIEQFLHNSNRQVDRTTLVSLIKQCGTSSALTEGKSLHTIAITSGLDRDRYVGSFLVQMYGKCSSMSDAKSAFDRLHGPNVFSWTILIGAYAQNGHGKEAILAFRKMNCEGLKPDSITLLNVVSACSICCDLSTGEMLHDWISSQGLEEEDVSLISALINMYGKCRRIDQARLLFDRLHHGDPVVWNATIAAYAQSGHPLPALQLYKLMATQGVRRTCVTYVAVLRCFNDTNFLGDVREVHSHIKHAGLETDAIVGTSLVTVYGRCRCVADAKTAFDAIARPNVVSWSAMVAVYAQNGHARQALEIYQTRRMKMNRITYISLLDACSCLGALSEGRKLHGDLRGILELEKDVTVSNALVNMYGKCGCLSDAKGVFDKMQSRDVVSWTSMIGAYAQRGHPSEALELYHGMLSEGISADDIIFVSVLFACSNSGVVELARDIFLSIVDSGTCPTTLGHYACMVDVLGRAGRLTEALELTDSMPFVPVPLVYMTLLSACTLYKNAEIGELIAEQLFVLEPTISSPYITLCNLYHAVGRTQDALRVRKLMQERGIKSSMDVDKTGSRYEEIQKLSLRGI